MFYMDVRFSTKEFYGSKEMRMEKFLSQAQEFLGNFVIFMDFVSKKSQRFKFVFRTLDLLVHYLENVLCFVLRKEEKLGLISEKIA